MNVNYGLYPIGEPYLYDVLERKLEKRSEKGWMADYIGAFLIRYKNCEPKRRKVQIVYDPENMEYETEKSDYTLGLEEYISSAGWVKACDYFKQKIYYNDDPDAVPIDTDDRVRLETIKESMVGWGFLTLVVIVCTAFFVLMFGDGLLAAIDRVTIRTILYAAVFLALPVYMIVSYVMYSIWLEKCEKNLEAGIGLASTEHSHIASIIMVISITILAGLLIVSNVSSDPNTPALRQILNFFSFFIIVSVGRRVGVVMKERKAGTAVTIAVMCIAFLILKFLFDLIIGLI